MANALTAARVLLALPFAFLMTREDSRSALLAALLFAVAIVTDVLDGVVARRLGRASAGGRLFDHATDCFFVTSALVGGAVRGAFPWILPVLVAAAFVQYVVDSYWLHRDRALRTSALGRWNGILYFARRRNSRPTAALNSTKKLCWTKANVVSSAGRSGKRITQSTIATECIGPGMAAPKKITGR